MNRKHYIITSFSKAICIIFFAVFSLSSLTWLEEARGQETAPSPAGLSHSAPKLTLSEAVSRVLESNPLIEGMSAEIEARDGAVLQAGMLPNPELGTEVENFAGQGETSAFKSAETTIYLSQLVELGSKRQKRLDMAMHDKSLARWDYEKARLELLSDTAAAFINVLAAQELAELDRALAALAEKSADTIRERVRAGKVSPVEMTRAMVELASAKSELATAEKRLIMEKERLAALWNHRHMNPEVAAGDLEDISPPPDMDSACRNIDLNPDIARYESEIAKNRAALELERAKAIPDVTFSAGVRNFQETDDNAFVMGISIPMPLFDRNQGGIKEAVARLERSRQMQKAARRAAESALRARLHMLSAAYSRAVMLRDTILPGARSAFEATEEGYRAGKFSFVQLIDAQRTYFNVKRQYIEALKTFHITRTEVDRLAGITMKSMDSELCTIPVKDDVKGEDK